MPDTQKNPALVIEPDRVIMNGEWGSEIIYDVAYPGTANIEAFKAEFEIVKGDHMADPAEDFFQGVSFMALIRRKSDSRLFGYPYWKPVAKHADTDDVDPNGYLHGFESDFSDDDDEVLVDGPYWVWLPVEPFTITGYKLLEK